MSQSNSSGPSAGTNITPLPPMTFEQEGTYSSGLQCHVFNVSYLSEDNIIHSRITNDERALRRVVKKFDSYAAVAHTLLVPNSSPSAIDDAREAFLVELASFSLQLKKAVMVCEAEARQVEEYQRERQRIGAYRCILDCCWPVANVIPMQRRNE